MRGKADHSTHRSFGKGITPARAGKRNPRLKDRPHPEDHPRACGEKFCGLFEARPCQWITPARAGKSIHVFFIGHCHWDHPRACGEKFCHISIQLSIQGSPPRVRGKAKENIPFDADIGITPARAGKRSAADREYRACRDHPRACGEKRYRNRCREHNRGSPPRVRGKDAFNFQIGLWNGITPARAGKSLSSFPKAQTREDHPRACGEKPSRFAACRWLMGSPPRVRGKAGAGGSRAGEGGITPARAGKSPLSVKNQPCSRDHPRACGEKCRPKVPFGTALGSPPRVRGKAASAADAVTAPGITPARAGKRYRYPFMPSSVRDHPRACGEKRLHCRKPCRRWGSPPRVRGKARTGGGDPQGFGITPARAGKRARCLSPGAACRDHPRACGEKGASFLMSKKTLGSPPRVRGKDCLILKVLAPSGITPARAGKSNVQPEIIINLRDHPRACGEKTKARTCANHAEGSPPRVRGKVLPRTQNVRHAGITPARAGKST